VIEARNLTKRFGATVAVSDLSFTVRPGVLTARR
jgi:ABC-2 type transport system ATP-binding protein